MATSIYGPRVGSGIYGTGYGDKAGQVLPQAMTRFPQQPEEELPQQPLPELQADPSLLRRAADSSLSGLSMMGNLLDTPGAVFRNLISWIPGGVEAHNPFTPLLHPFSDQGRVSGEQMLAANGLLNDTPNDSTLKNVGQWLAGTALEVGLDPLTYATFGASALGKGGKLAKAAGLADDATKVAARKAGAVVGPRQARRTVSARELAENIGQEGYDRLVAAYNGQNAKAIAKGKLTPASTIDDIPAELLDSAIGGNMRLKLPFMDERIIDDIRLPGGKMLGAAADSIGKAVGNVPVPKTGKTIADFSPAWLSQFPASVSAGTISGEAIAKAGDAVGGALRYGKFSPITHLAPYFSRALRGTKTREAQETASELTRRLEESVQLARDDAIEQIKEMYDSGYLDADQTIQGATAEETTRLRNLDIMRRANQMTDHLEGVSNLPPELDKVRATLDKMRDQYRELDLIDQQQAVNRDALESLGYVKKKVMDAEGNVSEVDIPSPIGYATRVRQFLTGPVWKAQHDARRMPVKDGFSIRREDYTRHLPTSKINEMSVDPKYAGVFDRGVSGRRGGFSDWWKGKPDTGVMGSTPVDEAAKKALRDEFFKDYDPLTHVDPQYLTKADGTPDKEVIDAILDQHSKLFDSITELNREQALKGVPMYALNPAESLLKRLESGYQTLAGTLGARDALASFARVRSDSEFAVAAANAASPASRNLSSINLLDNVGQLGVDYQSGKDALVKMLPDADRITKGIADQKLQTAATELDSLLQQAFPGGPPVKAVDALQGDLGQLRSNLKTIQDDKLRTQAEKLVDDYEAPIKSDDILKHYEIDSEIGADLARINRSFRGPEEANVIGAGWDALTNLFKGSVTAPFPSFHVRNAMSAFVQNALNGIHDPTKSGVAGLVQPYKDAKQLITGKEIKGAADIPIFAGRGLTDAQATDEIRKMIFSRGLADSPGQHNDIAGSLGGRVIDNLIGTTPIKDKFAAPEGTTFLESINPLLTEGVKGGEGKFAPIRIGRAVGDLTEQTVRSAPFIALLKQGVDPDEAARMVKRLHVDYGDLTDFERKVIRRAIPFYSFNKGATKYLASELAQKPGGAIAMTIKGAENASGNDPGAPSNIRASLNIPLGTNEDGSTDYFVGAGLMHEPPLQVIGPSLGSTLFNVAGMMHPGIKLPWELLTNESLFQEGADGGGRSLDDLDPLLGRTLSNAANFVGLTDRTEPYRLPGGKLLEATIANSPAARALHQVRKATDPRKGITTKLLDSLTGFKIATVDPEDSDAVLREQAQQMLREMGGRDFSHAYLPDNVLDTMQGGELEQALALQDLLKELNNRQRKRKKNSNATVTQ